MKLSCNHLVIQVFPVLPNVKSKTQFSPSVVDSLCQQPIFKYENPESFHEISIILVRAQLDQCGAGGNSHRLGAGAQGSLVDGTGGRTNVDRASKYLPAGTYNVDEFNFWGVNTNGTVQPFLSTGTATPQYTAVWAGTAGGAVAGTNTVSYTPGAQQFILTAPTRIYSGFAMTQNAVGYASGGNTDHNGLALTPAVGNQFATFSNLNLSRTYNLLFRGKGY